MKKVLAIALALILIGAAAYAAIDLSGMSFDELMALRQQVDKALWASDGWQEVDVPRGMYIVGEDIPAGKWSIVAHSSWCTVKQYTSPDAKLYKTYDILDADEVLNVNLQDGMAIEFGAKVTFTPYTGAALGFK